MSFGQIRNFFMKRYETLSNEKIEEMCDVTFRVGFVAGLIAICFAALGAIFFFTNEAFKRFVMSVECDFFENMKFVILMLCITAIASGCLYFTFYAEHKARWQKNDKEKGTIEPETSMDKTTN